MHQAFMNFKKAIKVVGLVVTSGTLISFGATQAFAGTDPAGGIGDSSSGGAVDFTPPSAVINSTETAIAIDAAAKATSINLPNGTTLELGAPISAVIATLASSEALQSISVTLPGGTFTLGALLNNVAVALGDLGAANGVSLPTALNDIIIALNALKSADVPPGAGAEVEQAITLVQSLRDAVP